jgi:hypothetical protein
MKSTHTSKLIAPYVLLAGLCLPALAEPTAFTYQGRLRDGTNLVSGLYDLRFALFDDASVGNAMGLPLTNSGVLVSNGLFTTTLNYGQNVFDGRALWLQIAARGSGGGAFTEMSPRQPLTPAPYSLRAVNAGTVFGSGILGPIGDANLSPNIARLDAKQTFTGDIVFQQPVGIGTSAPRSLLDVLGGNWDLSNTEGDFRIGDSGHCLKIGVATGGGGAGDARIRASGGTSRLMLGSDSLDVLTVVGDKVGINTITPGASLDVNGSVTASSLNVGGTVTASAFSGNGAVSWQTTAGTSQQAQANRGYIANNASQVTVTLPSAPSAGSIVRVAGLGAGGWKIVQNSGQSIIAGNLSLIPQNWTVRESPRMWSAVASSSDGSKLVAVVNGGQIYTSTDSGVSWTARETSRYWWSVASSSDGSKLVAATGGVYGTGQIYTSADSGVSWTPRETSRYWWSVASSSDGSKLVAVVGGLSGTGQIYTSTDSGTSWTPREFPRSWCSVASSSDGGRLAAVAYGGQIHVSTNGGTSWTARENNREWYSIASSSDGTRLVAVAGGPLASGQIYTSADSGVSWTPRESSRNWSSVASSSDGSKLVAGVWTGQIYTSIDSGGSWTPRESVRSWISVASSSDGSKLAAVDGGQIYTSWGASATATTSVGAGGCLLGGASAAIELLDLGNNQFLPLSHEGVIIGY